MPDPAQVRANQMQRLSKFLMLVLRHRPPRFPLKLDERGFADLADVLRLLQGLPNFRWATRSDVEALLALPGSPRFEIVGERIRALRHNVH